MTKYIYQFISKQTHHFSTFPTTSTNINESTKAPREIVVAANAPQPRTNFRISASSRLDKIAGGFLYCWRRSWAATWLLDTSHEYTFTLILYTSASDFLIQPCFSFVRVRTSNTSLPRYSTVATRQGFVITDDVIYVIHSRDFIGMRPSNIYFIPLCFCSPA